MIAGINGTVVSIHNESIYILTDYGITFSCNVPKPFTYVINQKVSISTILEYSERTGCSLYGFENNEEKKYFLLLRECSGIGPKLSMVILSTLTIAQIYDAIIMQDSIIFEKINGLGKKKAAVILFELKNKFNNMGAFSKPSSNLHAALHQDFFSALLSLGYSDNDARKLMYTVLTDPEAKSKNITELITQAVRITL